MNATTATEQTLAQKQAAGLRLLAQMIEENPQQFLANRGEVCELKVVGTREVVEEVPDPEALAAVPTTTVKRTEEITEWVCSPLLAAAEEPAAVTG